jgi:hypothetical protein
MWAVAPYLIPLAITVMANWGLAYRVWKSITYLALSLLNAIMLCGGLFFLAFPRLVRMSSVPLSAELQGMNFVGIGTALSATALLGSLCLVPPWRHLLARWLPLDPESPVHTVAQCFFVYLAATSLVPLLTDQKAITSILESASLGTAEMVSGQVIFVLIALAGVGLGIRRNPRETVQRLGIAWPQRRHWLSAGVAIVALLTLDYVVSVGWYKLWPASYALVSESSAHLFAGFTSPVGALLLALSAGIGEETLFRGAIQPRFRIPATAILFAVSHMQYGISPAMLEIFIVGLVLGWVREKCNTTTCMVVHAGYNFFSILLSPLLP